VAAFIDGKVVFPDRPPVGGIDFEPTNDPAPAVRMRTQAGEPGLRVHAPRTGTHFVPIEFQASAGSIDVQVNAKCRRLLGGDELARAGGVAPISAGSGSVSQTKPLLTGEWIRRGGQRLHGADREELPGHGGGCPLGCAGRTTLARCCQRRLHNA
jgi:hypothetical protein